MQMQCTYEAIRCRCIYLFGALYFFQHCKGRITMVSFVGRGNQYIQMFKVLNCNLPIICKRPSTFPHKFWGLNCRPQRWEASVLLLYHRGQSIMCNDAKSHMTYNSFITRLNKNLHDQSAGI